MAHGAMNADSINAHQALHGYADGHRLIAGSISVKPRDAKTMLVLSDISGPGALIDENGYLTGYPLSESGFYAFARTWPAPEMPRPGCVWTHTLLIDFSDLASLAAPGALAGGFRRPASDTRFGYDVPLTLSTASAVPPPLGLLAADWTRRLLASLYGKPLDKIVASRPPNVDLEQLALILWAQQWPRLRRAFRFCTFAVADRSNGVGTFDLQLLPSRDRSMRARFPEAVDAEHVVPESSEGWLEYAFADIMSPRLGGLRDFLRQVGGDVSSGREAFAPLCRLYGLIGDLEEDPKKAMEAAIALLEGPLAGAQPRAALSIVACTAADHADLLDRDALGFVVRHLDLVDLPERSDRVNVLGRALWSHDPPAVISMLQTDNARRLLAEGALNAVPISELLTGLQQTSGSLGLALTYRPELVEHPEFWAMKGARSKEAFNAAQSPITRRGAALAAMIDSGRLDLAEEAIARFSAPIVLSVLTARLDQLGREALSGELDYWLQQATFDAAAVAQTLFSGAVKTSITLILIARATFPDAVPNDYGEDPWLTAVRRADGIASEQGKLYLAAYLFARAVGSRSRNQAELAVFEFDLIYAAAARSQLSDEAWGLLDRRLPWSYFAEWDRCQRLRAGIVTLFVDRDLSPLMFGQVTRDSALFLELAEIAGTTRRGRRYLRKVREALREHDTNRYAATIRAIDRIAY
jgi:hypothetical protein